VPIPAVSSCEGFQTPAAVGVGMFVTAGVWKPSHNRTKDHFKEWTTRVRVKNALALRATC
jgi:hypothetical protein